MESNCIINLCWHKRVLFVVKLIILIIVATATTTPCAGQNLTVVTPATSICASRSPIPTLDVPAILDSYWIEVFEENQFLRTVKSVDMERMKIEPLSSTNTFPKNGTICSLGTKTGIISSTLIIFGKTDAICYWNYSPSRIICELPNPNGSLSGSIGTSIETDVIVGNCSSRIRANYLVCQMEHAFSLDWVHYVIYLKTTDSNFNNSTLRLINMKINETLIVETFSKVSNFSGNEEVTLELAKHEYLIFVGQYRNNKSIECEFNYGIPKFEIQNIPKIMLISTLRSKINVTIDNLIPNQEYDLSIRCRINPNYDLWCDSFNMSFVTLPARPVMPPETFAGAFYVANNKIILFWQRIPLYLYNATNLSYSIAQLNRTFIDSMAVLNWDTKTILKDFFIQTTNAEGSSLRSSTLSVYGNATDQHKPNNLKYHIENKIYTISWKPPKIPGVCNYTVLWCQAMAERKDQCVENGKRHLTYVDGNKTEFIVNMTMTQQDMPINMAISANFPDFSSGLNWVYCNDEWTGTVETLSVKERRGTSLTLGWGSLDRCSFLVEEYILEYSEDSYFTNIKIISIMANGVTKNIEFTLRDLQPITHYYIRIKTLAKKKTAVAYSDIFKVETTESPPSPPLNLKYREDSITTNSVSLSWQAPMQNNGVLINYIVYYTIVNDSMKIIDPKETNETNITLKSLKSYTEYEVYVTAKNTFESDKSQIIKFRTLMDVPTAPQNIEQEDEYLTWTAPEVPSGRVDFYIVSLILTRGIENEIFSFVPVMGNSYKMKLPECEKGMSYRYQVQAINLVKPGELPAIINKTQSLTRIEDIVHEYYPNHRYKPDNDPMNYKTIQCSNDGKLIPLDRKPYNEVLWQLKQKLVIKNVADVKFLCSPWNAGRTTIDCLVPSFLEILAPTFYIICVFLIMTVSLWGRRRCKNLEIKPILPMDIQKHLQVVNDYNKESPKATHIDVLPKRAEVHAHLSAVLENSDESNYKMGSLTTYTTMLSNTTSSTENLHSRSLSPAIVESTADQDLSSESCSLEYISETQSNQPAVSCYIRASSLIPKTDYAKIEDLIKSENVEAVSSLNPGSMPNGYIKIGDFVHPTNESNESSTRSNNTNISGYVLPSQLTILHP